MSEWRGVDRSQARLKQQIEDAERAQQEILDKLVESQARLARLRKQKEYIDTKSAAQSAALEAELDREEAEEALLQNAANEGSALVGDADFAGDAGAQLTTGDSFLDWRPGEAVSPSALQNFDFGSPPVTQG